MAAAEEDEAPEDNEGDVDDDWDFLDAWASRWEQEFQRFNAAEDERLTRVAGKMMHLAVQDGNAYHDAVSRAVEESDVRARILSRKAAEVEKVEHARAVDKMNEGAAQARSSQYHEALLDGDDMVRHITERNAARRLEREAKRREERMAQQRRRAEKWARHSTADADTGASESSASAGGSRQRSNSQPPRFTRIPGENVRLPPPTTFEAYNAAWKQFEQQVALAAERGGGAQLQIEDVPWPCLLSSVSGILLTDSPKERKSKLRTAVLRWHPDKWGPVLEVIREADRGRVMERVKGVTQRILEERKRLYR